MLTALTTSWRVAQTAKVTSRGIRKRDILERDEETEGRESVAEARKDALIKRVSRGCNVWAACLT